VNRRAGAAGFTLVELLIALTLVGLLTTLVYGGLRLAAQAWSRVERQTADAADLGAVAEVLRHALSAAYPAYASAEPSDRAIAFDGEVDSVALVAPLPQAIAAGVPAQLRFFVVGDERPRTLVMGWRFDLPASDGDGPLPENRLVLLDHVRAIRFAYFGADAADDAPDWHPSWRARDRLPRLIRIHVERDRASLPDGPDITAEPMAAMNSGCRYDPAALGCRRTR
jgi:general secretion pathway protein J